MVSQRPSLLIDTNVWLDYFLPDRAGGKEAIDLIVFAFEYEFPLLYPAAIVKDVFYVAVSTFKRIARAEKGSLTQSDAVTATETAWGCVNSMRKQATAVGADESDLWTACNLRSVHNDLEDNLVVAAAQRADATYLVTNDEALIKHAPVAALATAVALNTPPPGAARPPPAGWGLLNARLYTRRGGRRRPPPLQLVVIPAARVSWRPSRGFPVVPGASGPARRAPRPW